MEQRLSKEVMILTGAGQIGMAIARTIVELHGGTCTATNRPTVEGGGALVTIELPYNAKL